MTDGGRAREGGEGLWIPGPTYVRPDVLRASAAPMEGHRTASTRATIAALDAPLAEVFGADGRGVEVGVHSCTASALMEMGLRATGPRVLSLVNGAFSERFAEIAEALGKQVTRVPSPPGAPADLAAAAERVDGETAPFDAITVCASETSTGVLTAPGAIGDALRDRRGAMLLVDAVTLLGAGPVDASANGLDLVVAGTQKALAVPPGLGLYAASRALLDAAARRPSGSWFLDLARLHAAHRAQKPPMTPTLSLLRALEVQLAAIQGGALETELASGWSAPGLAADAGGFARRFARHGEMARRTRAALAELGLAVFGGDPAAGSPSVTCVDLGGGVSGADLVRALADRGLTIAPGYGDLKDRCVRIGHMGDHSLASLDALLEALAESVAALR